MSKLEKALIAMRALEARTDGIKPPIGPVAMTVSVVLFLGVLLSIPIDNLKGILWMAVWLVVGAPWLGISFTSLLLKSLVVLPLIALIGIFNPVVDRQVAIYIYGIGISHGWITFIGIALRGMLCVQAAMLLIESSGFRGVCQALSRLGMPKFLVNQLLMVYRYIRVLLEEALSMRRARESRGFGVKRMPLRMWGPFVGQLFLRSVTRAEHIHRAMLCRGYNGEIPNMYFSRQKWTLTDSLWLVTSVAVFTVIRIWGCI